VENLAVPEARVRPEEPTREIDINGTVVKFRHCEVERGTRTTQVLWTTLFTGKPGVVGDV